MNTTISMLFFSNPKCLLAKVKLGGQVRGSWFSNGGGRLEHTLDCKKLYETHNLSKLH